MLEPQWSAESKKDVAPARNKVAAGHADSGEIAPNKTAEKHPSIAGRVVSAPLSEWGWKEFVFFGLLGLAALSVVVFLPLMVVYDLSGWLVKGWNPAQKVFASIAFLIEAALIFDYIMTLVELKMLDSSGGEYVGRVGIFGKADLNAQFALYSFFNFVVTAVLVGLWKTDTSVNGPSVPPAGQPGSGDDDREEHAHRGEAPDPDEESSQELSREDNGSQESPRVDSDGCTDT